MKVILRKSVEPLGIPGDVVTVATGYARNYLLPKSLAYPVTPDNLKRIETERVKFEEEERSRLGALKAFAKQIRKASCTIEAKASEEGHLYGSVTPAMISEALAKEGIKLEAKSILPEKPIKETGVFTVPVHLHAEINTELKVWVMDASGEGKPATPSEMSVEEESAKSVQEGAETEASD